MSESRRVVVFHRGYGCGTGCCGHAVRIDEREVDGTFYFDHRDESDDETAWAVAFAKERLKYARPPLTAEHMADLDWDHVLYEREWCDWD